MNRPNPPKLLPVRLLLIAYWLALVTGTHWPRLRIERTLGLEESAPFALGLGLDKWLHFTGFAGLAWLFMAAGLLRGRLRRPALATAALLIAYAAIDESMQAFAPGRSPLLADWLASSLGIVAGVLAWGATARLFGRDLAAGGFVAHVRTVSAMTILSRVFGLLRDRALAWAFGLGGALDALVLALLIPNLFRRLFGEGALAAAFIPQYARLRRDTPHDAPRFAYLVLKTLAAVLIGLALLAVAILAVLLWAVGLDDRGDLAGRLTLITIWYMPLVCIAAVMGAMLQVLGRFAVPAASPIVLNLAIIGASLAAVYTLGEAAGTPAKVFLVAAAVVIAGAVQVAWHWIALRREGRRGGTGILPVTNMASHTQPAAATIPGDPPAPDDPARDAGRRLMVVWLPTVLGLAVFQINTFADVLIATFFSGGPGDTLNLFGRAVAYPMEIGAVATLAMAQRLYEFPLGVFGIAVATAIYPQLAAAAGDAERFGRLLRQGLRLTVFIGLPASIGLLLVREPLARAIFFQGGELTAGDAARIAWVLTGYAPAVWAYSMNHILTRGFYAHGNARTPMRLALAMVGLNVVLNLLLIWPLGTAGLAWSTAICAMLQAALLLALVRRYAAPIDARVIGSWLRVAALTALMAAAVWLAIGSVDTARLGWPAVVATLALGVGAGLAVYMIAARLIDMAELRWLLTGRTDEPEPARPRSRSRNS